MSPTGRGRDKVTEEGCGIPDATLNQKYIVTDGGIWRRRVCLKQIIRKIKG